MSREQGRVFPLFSVCHPWPAADGETPTSVLLCWQLLACAGVIFDLAPCRDL